LKEPVTGPDGGERRSILLVPPAASHQLVCDDSFSWTLIRFDAERVKMRKWDIAQTREFQETFSGFDATGHSPARSSANYPNVRPAGATFP
jgi:hypothetical protein